METTAPTTTETVARIVAEAMQLARVPEPTEALEALGIDSLDALSCVMACEEAFGVELDDVAIEGVRTVGDLADLCDKARGAAE